jgi:formamidopyrimidine-DNA glycosylase
MPELPEVETIRKGLEEYLVGHTIKDVEVRMPKIVQGEVADVIGGKVTGVRRFGKGLVIDLDNEYLIAIHIKLTGQLVFVNDKTPEKVKVIKGTYSTLPAKSTHVIFQLDKGGKLFYNDFRRFGWIKIIPKDDLQKLVFFKELGPEFPLVQGERIGDSGQARMTKQLFAEILKKTKGPIKPLLLDQKKMSGLGNIYANDGLWDAKIDPKRSAKQISGEEIERLYTSLLKVLKKGLETGGASELSYVNALGQEGSYQKHFLVYGQEGKPCKRDGTILEKIMLGGRGTYFCKECQK